jgi:hypothetical protein
MATGYMKWGGRPRPRRTPWSGSCIARKADEGVGRGPGGPPYKWLR